MRFGLFCLPAVGHLNPAHALGRRLLERGHAVACFQTARARAAGRAAGLELRSIDIGAPSPHYLGASVSTVDFIAAHAVHVLAARESVAAAGLEALIVDHGDLAAGTLAEHLGLPFVNVAFSVPFLLDASIPPPTFGWKPHPGRWTSLRNRAANWVVERAVAAAVSTVNAYRRRAGLRPHRRLNDVFSARAVITQAPEWFDFPRPRKPRSLVHAGPFVDGRARYPVEFPWRRLDGRPLVYASLGTVRNDARRLFQEIAWACDSRDIQLVLSLGGRIDPVALGPLPDNVIAVPFAPQLELLSRAVLMVTHAGLNSTLEALMHGVPLLAVPLADDQPGTAARIEHWGVGRVVRPHRATRHELWRGIHAILTAPRYREAATMCAGRLRQSDGLELAALTIERALGLNLDGPIVDAAQGLASVAASDTVPA